MSTESIKEVLKRIADSRAGWIVAIVMVLGFGADRGADLLGVASQRGAKAERNRVLREDVDTLKEQYGAIRSDLTEIKVQLGRLASKVEDGGGPD